MEGSGMCRFRLACRMKSALLGLVYGAFHMMEGFELLVGVAQAALQVFLLLPFPCKPHFRGLFHFQPWVQLPFFFQHFSHPSCLSSYFQYYYSGDHQQKLLAKYLIHRVEYLSEQENLTASAQSRVLAISQLVECVDQGQRLQRMDILLLLIPDQNTRDNISFTADRNIDVHWIIKLLMMDMISEVFGSQRYVSAMQFLITISIFPMLELKRPALSSPSCSIEIPVSNNCAATDSRCCAVFGGRLQTTDNNSFKSSSTVFTLGQDSLRGKELCP